MGAAIATVVASAISAVFANALSARPARILHADAVVSSGQVLGFLTMRSAPMNYLIRASLMFLLDQAA